MTYASIVEMVRSQSLTARIAAAAAEEGQPGPEGWAVNHAWAIVASGGWEAAWDSAKANASPNANPDTGARDDVISDQMILSAVQPMVSTP